MRNTAKLINKSKLITLTLLYFTLSSPYVFASQWLLIDNFESKMSLTAWSIADTKNDTVPRIENPQVTKVLTNINSKNRYMIKKPAPDGIVGNRKALTYKPLPVPVAVGETYTFFTRINVAAFPNNHAFGISNMKPQEIEQHDYNAFEPTLRVTDKTESNGKVNTGALMVKVDGGYANIKGHDLQTDARPLAVGIWYKIWYVVNNAPKNQGGQTYDVYLQGGDEFLKQTNVFTNANFRMSRELPLIAFLMNCNTGSKKKPYGNGGLKYDDLYMIKGFNLTDPTIQ